MLLRTSLLAFAAASACLALPASAAESYDNCTGFIDSLPATIDTPGTWCLRQPLTVALTDGAAIRIDADNVTLDCNHFGVTRIAGGAGDSYGVLASGVHEAVRRCHVAGFAYGIHLNSSSTVDLLAHRVEDNTVHGSAVVGISVSGDGSVIRGNTVTDTGGPDGAIGIHAFLTVDVLDNTVERVAGQEGSSATGISVGNNQGGRVQRNRVRGISAGPYSPGATGIGIGSGSPSVRDNDVATSASGRTTGVSCGGRIVRVRGNIIKGFRTGMSGCSDAGGNDVTAP